MIRIFKRHIAVLPLPRLSAVPDLPTEKHVELVSQPFLPYKIKFNKSKTPVLMIHDFLGSKSNLKKIGIEICKYTSHPTWGVDIRNHGKSANAFPFNYDQLVDDLINFIQGMKWKSCILVGDSTMGGRIAMLTSLRNPKLVEKLIVLNAKPNSSVPSVSYDNALLTMAEVESNPLIFKRENDAYKRVSEFQMIENLFDFNKVEPNLKSKIKSNMLYKLKDFENVTKDKMVMESWKVPVMNFLKHNVVSNIGNWPLGPDNTNMFHGPTFIIHKGNIDKAEYEKYFSNLKFKLYNFTGLYPLSLEPQNAILKKITKFINPNSENVVIVEKMTKRQRKELKKLKKKQQREAFKNKKIHSSAQKEVAFLPGLEKKSRSKSYTFMKPKSKYSKSKQRGKSPN